MVSFLQIERVFAGTEEGSLFARVSLIGQPSDLAKGLRRYGQPQDGGTAVILPIPKHQSKLAAAGALRHLCVSIERGMINRAEFVDRADGRGSTAKESEVEFTKMQHDPNSTAPAHRPAADLNTTLMINKGVRHAVRVGDQGKDDALNAALQKFVAARKGGSATSDSFAKIHCDIETLKARVMRDAVEMLAKSDPRYKSVALELRKGGGSGSVERPSPDVPDATRTDFSFQPAPLTEAEVQALRSAGRSPFVEAYVDGRANGSLMRTFTYTR